MDCISLFSGVGGMDLGVEAAGGRVVFANDMLRTATDTHRALFPHATVVHGPIADVRSFPTADLVVGGYPCQSFSMGGVRDPQRDDRTQLYREFARCLEDVRPSFFVAENVSGLAALQRGRFLEDQIELFGSLGYQVSWQIVRAQDYGVPQKRKRVFIVGVRDDLGARYAFPAPTHGTPQDVRRNGLLPYASHGDAIAGLPAWPTGEFYERPHDPEGHWSWYYMSRNRKARWAEPSFTVVANWRHTTLHPASPIMTLTWSNLADGWKQRWDFQDEWEHLGADSGRLKLDEARRLSWREAALIQTFPKGFEPVGTTGEKFTLIGNAVPPLLAERIVRGLIDGSALREVEPERPAGSRRAGSTQPVGGVP